MPYPKSAIIDPLARIGKDTKIDEFTYIGPHASIGTNCKIHRGVQIHGGAIIGNCVKIQDNAVIPEGVVISDDERKDKPSPGKPQRKYWRGSCAR